MNLKLSCYLSVNQQLLFVCTVDCADKCASRACQLEPSNPCHMPGGLCDPATGACRPHPAVGAPCEVPVGDELVQGLCDANANCNLCVQGFAQPCIEFAEGCHAAANGSCTTAGSCSFPVEEGKTCKLSNGTAPGDTGICDATGACLADTNARRLLASQAPLQGCILGESWRLITSAAPTSGVAIRESPCGKVSATVYFSCVVKAKLTCKYKYDRCSGTEQLYVEATISQADPVYGIDTPTTGWILVAEAKASVPTNYLSPEDDPGCWGKLCRRVIPNVQPMYSTPCGAIKLQLTTVAAETPVRFLGQASGPSPACKGVDYAYIQTIEGINGWVPRSGLGVCTLDQQARAVFGWIAWPGATFVLGRRDTPWVYEARKAWLEATSQSVPPVTKQAQALVDV